MISLGRNLYLWRVERKLTQNELARRTGISRPNLSVIEQGGRDITVSTLLRLAKELDLSPGILVDGVPPCPVSGKRFSRRDLDRISRFILGERLTLKKEEHKFAELLAPLLERKILQSRGHLTALPRTARKEKRNWILLRANYHPDDVKTAIARVSEAL